MSTLSTVPDPQQEKQIIRLEISRYADVWRVTCDMCHKIVFTGTPADFNLTLEAIIRTAAALHRH